MTFSSSTSPDITESIPGQLSQRSTSLPNPSSKIRFDLDINNLHFLLKPSADSPYMRQSVPVQKQQQDTSKEPGEQSLEGYWIRSQNSWHKGAGISFYEPGAEPDTEYRFTESSGVDVWTQGQLTPLHKMGLTTTVATGKPYIQEYGPEGWVVTNDTAVVRGIPTGGATITIEAPPASANGRWYFFGTDKRVKVGSSAVADPGTGIWNAKTNTVIAKNATKMPQVWYLKDRLIATHGKDVYEVPLNVATPVDFGTTTGAAYVPTDTGLQWLDATDGPSAIFLGFTDGSRDGVVRFTLQDAGAGSTPKLSQAYRVLDLPQGERLYKMFGYLGRFLLLSTSMGIRVCAVDGQGSLTMGQVSVPAAKTGRLNCFHANGSFVYVGGADIPASGTSGGTSLPGWTTTTGFIRINLGEPIGNAEDLRFAWANDIRTGVNGNVTSSVYMGNGRSAIAVEGSGVWDMDAFNLEPVGYIAMGRVRYSTFVPKIFRSLDLAGAIPGGTALRAQILDESDVAGFSISMDGTTGLFDTVGLDLTDTHRYVRPLLTLTSSSSTGPTITQVQLRSTPTPKRLRQIRYPLKCEDTEEDSRGQAFGRVGWAWERLAALEQMEEAGLPVSVIDRRTGESFAAFIDEIRFQGVTAPDRTNKNFSGTIMLTLTKLS